MTRAGGPDGCRAFILRIAVTLTDGTEHVLDTSAPREEWSVSAGPVAWDHFFHVSPRPPASTSAPPRSAPPPPRPHAHRARARPHPHPGCAHWQPRPHWSWCSDHGSTVAGLFCSCTPDALRMRRASGRADPAWAVHAERERALLHRPDRAGGLLRCVFMHMRAFRDG